MATWTNPRTLSRTTCAIGWQTAFGSAASAAGALARAIVAMSDLDRGQITIDPQGTNGSEYPRDTLTEVATIPKARLRFYAGPHAFMAAILEAALHGQSTATSAAGDLTESGDTGNALTTWSLTGVRPGVNTSSSFVLYVKYEGETPGGGSGRVSIYSDSARTQLVAQGSHAYAGTVTLAEQNSSGLSGTVAIASVTSSNLTGITLTVARVRFTRAAQVARWFTLFRDTGAEIESIKDCAIRSLKLESRENGPVTVEVEIVGSTYAIAATALTPSVAASDLQTFNHALNALTVNAIGQAVKSIACGLEHAIRADPANATNPVAVFNEHSRALPIEIVARLADESRVLFDDGVAGTWRAIVATYTYGSKTLSLTWARCKAVNPVLAATRDREFDDHKLSFEARDDGTNAPLAVTLDL